jgi:histidine triad (HIT) family protein
MADCLFCKMVKGEIKAKVAYEDSDLFAFHDINPQAPVHLLVIPKKHIEKISDLAPGDAELIGKVVTGAQKIASQNGWKDYRLVFNNGPESGQSVYHIHLHLLSGRRMTWPPG